MEDLIEDLIALHTASDPDDEYGFNTREIWDYRYTRFGYAKLFESWVFAATLS